MHIDITDPDPSPRRKSRRKRGVCLSVSGLDRFTKTRHEIETREGIRITTQWLAERSGLSTATIHHCLHQCRVDKSTLKTLFKVLDLTLHEEDYQAEEVVNFQEDWREAPSGESFYGREQELIILQQWVVEDRCRLVGILGYGGMGKTSLAVQAAYRLQSDFDLLIWRSLRSVVPLDVLLADVVAVIQGRPCRQRPTVTEFVHLLQSRRVLLLLDNLESILQPGEVAGIYRFGYEDYGELFTVLSTISHNSCVILTSREKPQEMGQYEGVEFPIRSMRLGGLDLDSAGKIFAEKGISGSEDDRRILVDAYDGNPLALKLASTTILELFEGRIGQFLVIGSRLLAGLRSLLEEQFERLTAREVEVMYWLAIHQEPVGVEALAGGFQPPISRFELYSMLDSLVSRSLIESRLSPDPLFTQHAVVMEFCADRLLMCWEEELITRRIHYWRSHAVCYGNSPEYIRLAQEKLLLLPLAYKVQGQIQIEDCQTILRDESEDYGYTAANLLQLALKLGFDLKALPFFGKYLLSVDLQTVNLAGMDLTGAVLESCHFAQPFNEIFSLDWHPSLPLIAAGTGEGEILVWDYAQKQSQLLIPHHLDGVYLVRSSPDGSQLVSASTDRKVRIWSLPDGGLLQTLPDHQEAVRGVCFAGNQRLVTAGFDGIIRVWELGSGKLERELHGGCGRIYSLALNRDGHLACGGEGGLQLWDLESGDLLWAEEDGWVLEVAFSSDQLLLAAAYESGQVRIRLVRDGKQVEELDHGSSVFSLSFSPNGRYLATACMDHAVGVWQLRFGKSVRWLSHEDWVRACRFSPDSQLLVTGGDDRVIRIWDVNSGLLLQTLRGYTNGVMAIAVRGQELITGSNDRGLRFWDLKTGILQSQNLKEPLLGSTLGVSDSHIAANCLSPDILLWDLEGEVTQLCGRHQMVWSLQFSPNGSLLASGSVDGYICLWDVRGAECLHQDQRHSGWIWSLVFDASGRYLFSGGDDGWIRIWDLEQRNILREWDQHQRVHRLALSSEGLIASAAMDGVARLWDWQGELIRELKHGDLSLYCSLFSSDGQLLFTAGRDGVIRCWDIKQGECVAELLGHQGAVWTLSLDPEGHLVSGSFDATVRVWEIRSGRCIREIVMPRLYEGMLLRDVRGLNPSSKVVLQRLGARVL